MAQVTPQGIRTRSLTEYLELTEEGFREAFGQDLDLAPETPQGQLAGIMALGFAEVEEAIAWLASGMSLHTSTDQQIDDWGSMLNLPRKPATFSTVELKFIVNQQAGEFNNGNYPVIPAGTLVRAENDDTQWATVAALPLDTFVERDGSIERVSGVVVAQPLRAGQVFAPENTLDTPVSVISNLHSVTNPSPAMPGINSETDAEYRIRHDRVVARASGNSIDALRARLLLLTGVLDAYVADNAEALPLEIGTLRLPQHNVLVITRAPAVADLDIARVIFNTMPPGIPTYNAALANSKRISADTLDARVTGRDVNWVEAQEVPVKMVVVLNPLQEFPAGGLATVLRRLGQYFRGEWRSGEGDFDTSGVGIGQFPNTRRLYSPINSVPGHTIRLMNLYHAGNDYREITEADVDADNFLVLRESETLVQLYAMPTLPDIQDRNVARNTAFAYQMPEPLTGNAPYNFVVQAKQGTPALPADWALDPGTLQFAGNSGNAARTYTLEFVVTDITGDTVVGEWEIEVL